MVTNYLRAFYLFDVLIPFLKGTENPLRPLLIGAIAILWLFCFSSLFSRDRRKAKLRYLAKRKQTVGYVEKRRHSRVGYPMPVRYRILSPQQLAGAVMVSNARNLSEDGILLEMKQDLPIDARLELKLALSSTGRSILVTGIVQRKEWLSSLELFAVGIAFENLPTKEQQELSSFIEQEQEREEIA